MQWPTISAMKLYSAWPYETVSDTLNDALNDRMDKTPIQRINFLKADTEGKKN